TIESRSKLSKDEIEKLKQDAEKFADQDKKKKEGIDLKNEAESFIYTTEKLVNHDLKDKISQEQGIKITDAIKELKDVLNKDAEQIKPKLDALKAIVNEITTELYKKVTPSPGTDQQGGAEQQTSGGQNP
ncbi:MAG: Hsp70 family protein, partial [Nitrosopumilaceae archaeon]|nr:Hsp70 family protein [Nitrosopumilaceae archaeon]